MQMDLKLLKTYFLLVSLFAFICFLFSYFTDQNYAINFLSFAQGSFIFLFINILYYLLQRRYRSSKLTPSFVLYEVIYAFVLKISLLIFLRLFLFILSLRLTTSRAERLKLPAAMSPMRKPSAKKRKPLAERRQKSPIKSLKNKCALYRKSPRCWEKQPPKRRLP